MSQGRRWLWWPSLGGQDSDPDPGPGPGPGPGPSSDPEQCPGEGEERT